MSATIDQRVVEMRFDNRHFESNVKTSMSTLERLKQSLRLTDASKGLENVSSAAKKVDMTGLGSAVDTVHAKFSALQVMGVTALANITNSAVNAGKRMVSALTIDPIKTGFSEYETQINATQTILANTQSAGKTLEDVTAVLDELNKYADQTIYNFTEMTRNIGTFTAAGVGLETSAQAIKGIANLAAMSGSTSQQASTAMYQLSQALASGTVKLMDWNSVVNAGMGGQVFQDALKETARVHGIAIDSIIAEQGSFRDSLSEGWLSAEILTETLEKFTLTTKGLTKEQIEANRQMLKAKGYTDDQIDAIFKLGDTATGAATEVKTFSQLWDTLKESAQSGWSQTWKLIVGDFNEAKNLLTRISDFFSGIINKMSDFRNKLLGGALANPFDALLNKLDESGLGKIKKVVDATEKMTNSLEYYQDVVTKVWRGDYKNAPVRYQLLEDDGYNHKVVQSLVNKGYQYKLTMEDVNEAQKKFGVTASESSAKADKLATSIADLTDEQLKNAGFTDEEIKLYRELAKEAERTGVTVEELVESMGNADGRTLLIESFENVGKSLVTIFTAIKDAWVEIFPPMTSIQLYNIIKALNEFSQHLVVGDETADKLKRTLKGLFALLDIVTTITGGALKFAIKTVVKLLGMADIDILSLTASAGDAIVKFRDWIDANNIFIKGFKKIEPYLKDAAKAIAEWIEGLKESDNIPRDIIAGLVNGLKAGIPKVVSAIIEVGKSLITALLDVLGIHSPSRKGFEAGWYYILGIIKGIKEAAKKLYETIKGVGSKLIDFIKNIDFGSVVAVVFSGGMLYTLKRVADAFEILSGPLEGVSDILGSTAGVVSSFGKVLKSFSLSIKAKAIKDIAIALAILVGSIVVLALIPGDRLWKAIGALTVLGAILAALVFVAGKFGPDKMTGMGKLAGVLLGLSASVLILAIALNKVASLTDDEASAGLKRLGILIGAIALLALSTRAAGKDVVKLGSTILLMSAAMLILVQLIKIIAKINDEDLFKGVIVIGALGAIMGAFILMARLAKGDITKLGGTLLLMSTSILIMVQIIKMIAKIKNEDVLRGLGVITAFAAILTGMVAMTKLGGKSLDKLGGTLLTMAASMMLMVMVIKMVSEIRNRDLVKGITVITLFGGILTGLIAATKLAGNNLAKLGATLMMMSFSIAILAGVAIMLGFIKIKSLAKGIIAVGMLAALVSMMTMATKDAKECKDNLIVMTVAIVAMAGAVAALSLIDGRKLAKGVGALSALMALFSLMVFVTKYAKVSRAMKSTLLVMTGVVVMLAGVVALMSLIDSENALKSTAALSLLLLSLTASLLILSKISGTAVVGLGTLAVLGLIALGLTVVIGKIADLDANAALAAVGVLSLLLLALTACLFMLSGVQPTALLGIVALALLAGVVSGFAELLGNLQNTDALPSMETVKVLAALLLTLTATLYLLIPIGALAPLALYGLGTLLAITAAIGAVLVGLGALSNKWKGLDGLLSDGLPILEKLGYALGSFVGSIVAGFSATAAAGLPKLAEDLSAFMDKLQPFIDGVGQCDEDMAKSVGILTASILALSAANFVAGVTSFMSIGSSFSRLGKDLSKFMDNAELFIDGASSIDNKTLAGVKALTEAILLITAANVVNGLTAFMPFLGGGTSLESFGKQLPQLGTDIAAFADNLGTFSDDQVKTIGCAISAIKAFALSASEIPNQGGLLAEFIGDNAIGTFGRYLPELGNNLKDFANNLGTFDDKKVETVGCAADAIAKIAKAAADIPNEGGKIAELLGDNGIAAFGSNLPGLGTNIKDFAYNLGGFDDDDVDTVKYAAEAIAEIAKASDGIPNEGGKIAELLGDNSIATFGGYLPNLGTNLRDFADNLGTFTKEDKEAVTYATETLATMTKLADGIPNEGGKIAWLLGDNSIATFSKYLPDLGTNLKNFTDNLGTFDDSKRNTVYCAVNSIRALTDLANADLSNLEFNVYDFGDSIVYLAGKIAEFCTSMEGASGIDAAITNVGKTKTMVEELNSIDISNARSFGEVLRDLGESGVSSFVKAFANDISHGEVRAVVNGLIDTAINTVELRYGAFAEEGSNLVARFVQGFNLAKINVSIAVTTMMSSMLTGINNKYFSFLEAGKYVVDGFAAGIDAQTWKAEAEAAAMAKAALEAAEEELGIQSPSKEFYKAGAFSGQGFINALSDYGSRVYNAGAEVAKCARNGLTDAVGKITDFINNDIDAQPTIRPVLDLSDVEAGAGSISSLFAKSSSMGVLANVNSISSMMNSHSQNGNADVVSAIDSLRKDLSNVGGTTYSINGVTYDDGSNISEAVKSIVRAAKIERRV